MEKQFSIPILLIGFNRPDTIKQVFETIRKVQPQKLYVAIDGPRESKRNEQALVDQVKNIVQDVDWSADVHFYFNEVNRGAEVTISSAIAKVLEKEEYVIILEDDIVAPYSFFQFMQEMLIKYKDDSRICIVSGNNYTPLDTHNNEDYFFSKYGHTWGWATWRRAWKGYSLNMEIEDKYIQLANTIKLSDTIEEAKFLRKHFKWLKNRGVGHVEWDYLRSYFHRINNQLAIVPRVNLASNIGLYGLHANGLSNYHFIPADAEFIVKKHPAKVECFTDYDKYHFAHHISKKTPITLRRMIKYLRKIIKL